MISGFPPQLHPLIDSTFERHLAGEVSDHDAGRDVEQQHRRDPEHRVRRSELSGRADPVKPDRVQELNPDQVDQAEFCLELGALQLDFVFGC
jgi:hypothetical protein